MHLRPGGLPRHQHHPRLILVECTTELASWGPALPGRPKVGDGSTYRWWLKQFDNLGYCHRVLYLNSMFFGVPQSRDRLYIAFWDRQLPAPDLEHRPPSWCSRCGQIVEAVWSWKTGLPPTGSVRYGKQYEYRCPSCRTSVIPPMTPSLAALDLTNLGTRIGDKPIKKFYNKKKQYIGSGPLAPATMARAERCRQRFSDFPAVLMPAKAVHGSERHPWQPMATQTSQQETALVSTGPAAVVVDNYQGGPRAVGDPLPTQGGSETLDVVSSGVIPYRRNTLPAVHAEAMPTVKNGATGSETAPHPITDPLGTLTARDTTALLMAEWRAALAEMPLEDCYFRMMGAHEVGRGCGFDVDFPDHAGAFVVWGSARDQVDGFGNAVSPPVGEWIGTRLRAVLHNEAAA